MKKSQGFIDPISLTFVMVLGIMGYGVVDAVSGDDNTNQQQLAETTQIELAESAEAAHQYLADN